MSFEKFFQELVGQAAGGRGGNTFVYVNVNLGQSVSSDPLGQVVNLGGAVGPTSNPKGVDKDAEAQAQQDEKERWAAAELEEHKHPEAAPKDTPAEVPQKKIRGTINQQKLVKKAVELGLPEAAGKRLWSLLMDSKQLRGLCADHGVPFPPLGRNKAFRRTDLRQLAKLDGLTKVPGFGSRSQACQVLKSL